MNNDINGSMNFPNAQQIKPQAAVKAASVSQNADLKNDAKPMQSSMSYLGTMGFAQVNMNNLHNKNVKEATEKYIKNPEFAESYVDLCDGFVEKGMPLEKAIVATDSVFNTLSDPKTYR